MEALYKRKVSTSKQYDKYFKNADMLTMVVDEDADLKDTIKLIKKMVSEYYPQTTNISKILDKKDVYQTCKAIWNFVYENIQYKLDQDGTEQLRTPNRTWKDRFLGVDCDCYSLFISTILTNLGIKHKFRLAEYQKKGYFQHIYIIVPYQKQEIIMDCVKDKFDDEQSYTKKEDIEMELQILSGFGNTPQDSDDNENYDDWAPVETIDENIIKVSEASFEEIYKEELAYFNTLKLSQKEITALQNYMNGLADSKKLPKTEFKDGIIDINFIETLKEWDLYKKESQIIQPLREKKWFTKEWFNKNSFEIVVFGGAGLLTLAFVISFMGGNENQPQQKKQVNGLGGTKKKPQKHKLK